MLKSTCNLIRFCKRLDSCFLMIRIKQIINLIKIIHYHMYCDFRLTCGHMHFKIHIFFGFMVSCCPDTLSILSGLSFTFCICLAVYVVSTASSCQDLSVSIFSPDHASVKIFTWMFHTHLKLNMAQTEQLFSACHLSSRANNFSCYFYLVTNSTIICKQSNGRWCHSRFLLPLSVPHT